MTKKVSIEFEVKRGKPDPLGVEEFEALMQQCEKNGSRVRLTLEVLEEGAPLPASARDSK